VFSSIPFARRGMAGRRLRITTPFGLIFACCGMELVEALLHAHSGKVYSHFSIVAVPPFVQPITWN